jgi:ABC-type transporter Mla MlaB component
VKARLALHGELDQDLLVPLWDKRHEAQGVTLIDLSDVTRVDTAGVALLVHLVALGKSRAERHAAARAIMCNPGAALQPSWTYAH